MALLPLTCICYCRALVELTPVSKMLRRHEPTINDFKGGNGLCIFSFYDEDDILDLLPKLQLIGRINSRDIDVSRTTLFEELELLLNDYNIEQWTAMLTGRRMFV